MAANVRVYDTAVYLTQVARFVQGESPKSLIPTESAAATGLGKTESSTNCEAPPG